MNVRYIQDSLNEVFCPNARVANIVCEYFADEVTVTFESPQGITSYVFLSCYRVSFDHDLDYVKNRPLKELTRAELPYFLKSIEVSSKEADSLKFYRCVVIMTHLELEVYFSALKIIQQKNKHELITLSL